MDVTDVVESNYGKIVARVTFAGIRCERFNFACPDGAHPDVGAIRAYGLAIDVARRIMNYPGWVYTEDGFLVCASTGKDVKEIEALLYVDKGENVLALARVAYDIVQFGFRGNGSVSIPFSL